MGRWLRVLTYLLAVQLSLAAWAVHGALAEARGQLASFGEGALAWATQQDGVHRDRIVINGLGVDVESSTRPESVDAVLDQARRDCLRTFAPTWQALWDAAVLASPLIYPVGARAPTPTPALGHADGRGGYIACLEMPPPQREDLRSWAGRFIAGGELTVPGVLHYTMVRPTAHGSTVVSLMTRGALRPTILLGTGGDVPHPSLTVPRPSASRVSLHAATDGPGPSVVVFTLAASSREHSATGVLQRYASELREHGFTTSEPSIGSDGIRWMHATDVAGSTHLISVDAPGTQVIVVR